MAAPQALRLKARADYEYWSANICSFDIASVNDPTVMQALAESHDSPLSSADDEPAGLNTVWATHFLPFHRSANGRKSESPLKPVATHSRADTQDTALRPLGPAPTGGRTCGVQVAPFHRSATGTMRVPRVKSPAAVHAPADVHETLDRNALLLPAGSRAACSFQLDPFQVSPKTPVLKLPTAVHALADAHDTPSNEMPPPAGLTVRWIFQLLPFHRSASVREMPARPAEDPMAVHALLAGHETEVRKVLAAPAGLGVC